VLLHTSETIQNSPGPEKNIEYLSLTLEF